MSKAMDRRATHASFLSPQSFTHSLHVLAYPNKASFKENPFIHLYTLSETISSFWRFTVHLCYLTVLR